MISPKYLLVFPFKVKTLNGFVERLTNLLAEASVLSQSYLTLLISFRFELLSGLNGNDV